MTQLTLPLQIVDSGGETLLRVRQNTHQGYADCSVRGCIDLSYPSSQTRRGRVIEGGQLTSTLMCCMSLAVFVEL